MHVNIGPSIVVSKMLKFLQFWEGTWLLKKGSWLWRKLFIPFFFCYSGYFLSGFNFSKYFMKLWQAFPLIHFISLCTSSTNDITASLVDCLGLIPNEFGSLQEIMCTICCMSLYDRPIKGINHLTHELSIFNTRMTFAIFQSQRNVAIRRKTHYRNTKEILDQRRDLDSNIFHYIFSNICIHTFKTLSKLISSLLQKNALYMKYCIHYFHGHIYYPSFLSICNTRIVFSITVIFVENQNNQNLLKYSSILFSTFKYSGNVVTITTIGK